MANRNQLTAIMIPMIKSELGALAQLFFLWGTYRELPNPIEYPALKLIITLDCKSDIKISNKITKLYKLFALEKVFSALKINYCDIPAKDNIYIRPGHDVPETAPKLGMKSGPNSQFFQSVTQFCKGENTVFLNEVDCFPVDQNWIQKLSQMTRHSAPFWVKGSPYKGRGRLRIEFLKHINGNALYGVGINGFHAFKNQWHQDLIDTIKLNPWMAYDTFLSFAYHRLSNPNHCEIVDKERRHKYSEYMQMVRPSDLIHNLGGDTEVSEGMKTSLNKYLEEHPKASNVHGRFLFDQVLERLLKQCTTGQTKLSILKAATFFWEENETQLANKLRSHYLKQKS